MNREKVILDISKMPMDTTNVYRSNSESVFLTEYDIKQILSYLCAEIKGMVLSDEPLLLPEDNVFVDEITKRCCVMLLGVQSILRFNTLLYTSNQRVEKSQ